MQELTKAYEKAKPLIMKEESGQTPRFYVRILVEMEDLINATWEDRKSLNKINAKALSGLRQKLRRYIREEFDDDMAKFRENPDAPDEEVQEDEDGGEINEGSDDDSDDELASRRKKSTSKSREQQQQQQPDQAEKDSDSDDSYWDSDSESSSSDSDYVSLRDKFLKKAPREGDSKEAKREAKKEKKKNKEKLRDLSEESDSDDERTGEKWQTVDRGGLEKPKMFEKDAEINHEAVIKKLHEIMAARGKKRTNRKEQIVLLTELLEISEEHKLEAAIYVKIQFALISAIFDYNAKISTAMKPEYWEMCMPAVEKLLDWIQENADDLTTSEGITDENESFEEKPYRVSPSLRTLYSRLRL